MSITRSYQEINEKIKAGKVVVVTAEEVVAMVKEEGPEKVLEKVDVVTTGTFGAMCSSGAFLNFGHSDPPIKMSKVWLNDVPAYAGLAAVDAYLGATELSESRGLDYGGAHVIEDLLSGEKIKLKAMGFATDCYPRTTLETWITLEDLNQAYLFNPRNAYQNYCVAINSTGRTYHTYMGTLLPNYGNATYTTSGELSPLLCDPEYRTIGVGTRIFLGGGIGYVAWEGTQHNPAQKRDDNGVPLTNAGTLAVIGDLKGMNRKYLRAGIFHNYGTSLYVGIGIPIPLLDEEILQKVALSNEELKATVYDYGVQKRSRPALGVVSYAELRSGKIELNGRVIPTAPLSSLEKARAIATELKEWILNGQFYLAEPVASLPWRDGVKPLREEV
ncbi:MAG: hypothetical protein GX050_03885 [Firmicutes bacterium]|nr:hypothetical protein [Bacillota bacterium]